MRSSKNRSRSKGNRNRSVGNIVNRVFDSSGPEGKVRGTPQQIIDKYNQLARDAQLGNDRVAAENFQQHAEHYLRLLSEAQREQESRRDQQQNQGGKGQGDGGRNDQPRNEQKAGEPATTTGENASVGEAAQADTAGSTPTEEKPFDAVMDTSDGESTLVETPESEAKPKRTRRPRRKPSANDDATDDASGEATTKRAGDDDQPPQEAAE